MRVTKSTSYEDHITPLPEAVVSVNGSSVKITLEAYERSLESSTVVFGGLELTGTVDQSGRMTNYDIYYITLDSGYEWTEHERNGAVKIDEFFLNSANKTYKRNSTATLMVYPDGRMECILELRVDVDAVVYEDGKSESWTFSDFGYSFTLKKD